MNFHEILNILIFNRKIIIFITLFSTFFLFLILLFIYPVTYSSEVKILPPESNSYSGLTSLMGNNDFLNLFSSTSKNNSQLYAEILKSRSAAEYVIRKCNLYDYLGTSDTYAAAFKLGNNLNVEVNKEGIVILSVNVSTPLFGRWISVNDSVKILSAKISNCYIEALDSINREKLNSRARNSREYIEKQLDHTKGVLETSELALKEFQENNKTISLPEQLTAALETAAKLKSEIILTEIQLGTLSENFYSDSKALEGLNSKLKQLNKQYSQIEAGDKLNSEYLPIFKNVPEISLQLARLTREVKIQNEVFLLLQKQYYTERIQENRDLPTVEVLDNAIPPLRAKSPRLFFHTLTGSLSIFLIISFVILFINKKNRL